LNPTGVFCWKRFDGKHSIAEIAAELQVACEDAPANAEADVRAFAEELVAKGLAGFELPSP
ncbi:MAG: PqqD family peptide modification chaperone, partial [Verrucomicrobiae bacterium]|nr:PqqD family peptide modification chaperone [Verrucomicrobiae bacterium]